MKFSEKLKYLRKRSGLSQAALGKKVGLTQQRIAGYENGERNPKYDMRNKIGKALHSSGDFLLDDSPLDELHVYLGTLRQRFGITQESLAECSLDHMQAHDIEYMETGRQTPSWVQLSDIIKRFEESARNEEESHESSGDEVSFMLEKLKTYIERIKYIEQKRATSLLDEDERRLIGVFNKLNDIGKTTAIERIEELTLVPRYQKEDS